MALSAHHPTRAASALSPLTSFFLLLLPHLTLGQFCTETCPPLNDVGRPISSLCAGDVPPAAVLTRRHRVCRPGRSRTVALEDFRGAGRVTVLANVYVGCNAGRREAAVFAHVGQRYYDAHPDRVAFVNSLKGGTDCDKWPGLYERDTVRLYPEESKDVKSGTNMPLVVDDDAFTMRDDFFTTPFGHPSYVVLDGELTVRHKFTGPCCGIEDYYSCSNDDALALDATISGYVDAILAETPAETAPAETGAPSVGSPAVPAESTGAPSAASPCETGAWSAWSPCSLVCRDADGDAGVQFRTRTVTDRRAVAGRCPKVSTVRECREEVPACDATGYEAPGPQCVPEFGTSRTVAAASGGFDDPRDVAFHPAPGTHLGAYSEGREYPADKGEEAWVLNGGNHSVSIVAGMGTKGQTTMSRRDRGYYHYMIEATALAFNSVRNSGREADRDSFGYWAVCNDNLNTYLDTKEPNYFMGPTLYNSDPSGGNTVNGAGRPCGPADECFLLHSDMLHEAPGCIGIAHDPETATAFGNVYWAFDSTGDRVDGQLVRFDFQQPHGPGSMDHSVASVRRYPEVKLKRGPPGVHAGMVVHPTRRELFVAVPGAGTVLAMGVDSGAFARTARAEYPIFSNRLPSFEYSIWECAETRVFAAGLATPSGLALSADGERLFVAEHATGVLHTFEVASGALLATVETGRQSVGGMAVSEVSGRLHFVDGKTGTLNVVAAGTPCPAPYVSRVSPAFAAAVRDATAGLGDGFSLRRDADCAVDRTVPDFSLFEQVHATTGYASNDTDVQGPAGMDADAYLLANRTDCGRNSDLNFDALLLGGFYCHQCLPGTGGHENGATCAPGGTCTNVQWEGFTCDNHFVVDVTWSGGVRLLSSNGTVVDLEDLRLQYLVTYRFTVQGDADLSVHRTGEELPLSLPGNDCGCAEKGPLLFTPTPELRLGEHVYLWASGGDMLRLQLGSICVDAPACAGISFLAKKEDREERCRSMEQDCPVACGHAKCYNFVRSCRDENRKELFGSLGMDQTCAWVDWMRTSMPGGLPNAWYRRICLSNHQPYDDNSQPAVDEDGTAIKVYDMLVQERCPVACLNRECTCADNEVPFVTVSSINSETETEIEGIRARTCADLFNIASWEYRNVVCSLDIHAVTSQFPVPLKVHDMCPTACGFRPECFCRDSKADIPTPSKKQKTRRCKDAAYYPESGRNYWCNEMEQPTFARSCPIQCQNAYCTSRNVDSLDTVSFNGGKLHTSCWLMSEGNAAYKSYCCNAMEDDLMVTGGALCPVTCADHMNE
mmetsp:Transcript_18058/g.36018  ORF Transcript_18058/g.36018 Transcript_18058/m.36018 type:complete len:1288 (+) Transcript_18058:253-4116(+)